MSDNSKYGKNYSDDAFWKKVKKFAVKAGLNVIYAALILYNVLQKDDVPAGAKAIIVGALGYFIFPLDLIPDITPGVGFSDDLGALAVAIGSVVMYIDEDVKIKAKAKLRDWFGDYDESELKEF